MTLDLAVANVIRLCFAANVSVAGLPISNFAHCLPNGAMHDLMYKMENEGVIRVAIANKPYHVSIEDPKVPAKCIFNNNNGVLRARAGEQVLDVDSTSIDHENSPEGYEVGTLLLKDSFKLDKKVKPIDLLSLVKQGILSLEKIENLVHE